MAFSGVRSFSGVATGGTRVCSIVACTGEAKDTCGSRFTTYAINTTAIFEELVITGTVPTPQVVPSLEADDSSFFPLSSTVAIMPLEPEDYSYSFTHSGDRTTHVLTLRDTSADLYSFALWGRVFETDGLEADPPLEEDGNGSMVNFVSRFLIVSVVAFVCFVQF